MRTRGSTGIFLGGEGSETHHVYIENHSCGCLIGKEVVEQKSLRTPDQKHNNSAESKIRSAGNHFNQNVITAKTASVWKISQRFLMGL